MFKLAILGLALTLASASHEANWLVYKQAHNKIYTEDEDVARRDIWETNLQQIEQHNELYAQGLSSFYLGENHFSDMTTEEFAKLMNGVKLNKQLNPGKYQTGVQTKILPSHVDWRTKGYVTPVKDQGQCGSCWAFSTTGSVEGQHFKATKRLVSLSESNLVDCSGAFGNQGCHGGYMDDAFQYIINNTGIDTEASYPYKPEPILFMYRVDSYRLYGEEDANAIRSPAYCVRNTAAGDLESIPLCVGFHTKNERCRFDRRNIGATIRSFKDIESGNEEDLKSAVALVGPVSVAIDANHSSFQFYKGGVYDEPDCSDSNLDHGVLVVGYGTQDDTDYWIVKNSWGISWGDHGYIKMSRNNNNQCGIATMASYPIV